MTSSLQQQQQNIKQVSKSLRIEEDIFDMSENSQVFSVNSNNETQTRRPGQKTD